MPKRCSICSHESRKEMDSLILAGQPLLSIARKFRVSEDALSRHKLNGHILRFLARESPEIKLGDSLLEQLESIQREALSILDGAKLTNDPRVALAAIREVREVITVLARIVGEIKEAPAVQIQQFITLGSAEISEVVRALLDSKVITLSEGEAESEDERQESVPIEDGDMSREVGDRCSEPPMQIA